MAGPSVRVRDRETGHEYLISEKRYKLTPELWERLDQDKPKTTVSREAAKKTAATRKRAAAKKAASGHQADSKQEES